MTGGPLLGIGAGGEGSVFLSGDLYCFSRDLYCFFRRKQYSGDLYCFRRKKLLTLSPLSRNYGRRTTEEGDVLEEWLPFVSGAGHRGETFRERSVAEHSVFFRERSETSGQHKQSFFVSATERHRDNIICCPDAAPFFS